MKIRLLITLACAAFAALIHPATAAPGDLDLTFGNGGKVTTAIGAANTADYAYSVAMQGDGKIVVAGNSHYSDGSDNEFAVVRYNPDGSLDATFNGNGKVTTGPDTFVVHAVAIQNDQKILVVGRSVIGSTRHFAVARYNPNGSLDTTFNGTGKVTTTIGASASEAYSAAIQGDGKIVIAGWSGAGGFAVVRYNPDGTLDTTFNGTGKVTTTIGNGIGGAAFSVAIQCNGKIVAAGVSDTDSDKGNFALVRFNGDGSLDTSFNSTGKVTTDFGSNRDVGHSVVIESSGKIIVVGETGDEQQEFALARYNDDGSLDTGFGDTGKVRTASEYYGASDVSLQTDGKIVVVGTRHRKNDSTLIRYLADGSLDTTFNGTGILPEAGGASVAIQIDGKIVVAGSSPDGFTVARYER